MKRILLLSDTHGYLDPRIKEMSKDVDEIWHAGDIGSIELLNELKRLKPTRAVFGNIDNIDVRSELKEVERFTCENVEVLMTHIGGYPGKYSSRIKSEMERHAPQIQVSGHSHILKVLYDKKYNCLHINPGAAGKYGIHTIMTIIKFSIDGEEIKDMEVVELGKRA